MPGFILGVLLLFAAIAAHAADGGIVPPTSDDDAFDMSQGNLITRSTPVIPGFNVGDMFGEQAGAEPGNTIFSDTRPEGDMDYVEFSTRKHVRLKGFRFIASSGLFLRPTDRIIFYVDSDGNGNYRALSTNAIQQVNPGTTPEQIIGQTADITQNLEPVVARHFRIEIFRPVWSLAFPGPRVVELDAITEPNASLPVTLLKSPANDTEYNPGDEVVLRAESSDPDGIRRVNFYANGAFIGSDEAAPFEFTWIHPEPGQKTLTARGVDFLDDEGGDSNPIHIVIKGPEEFPVELEAVRHENGWFRFEAHQLVFGTEYALIASENLVQWSLISTFFADDTMMVIEDEVLNIPHRYYKVVPASGPPPPP